MVPRPTGSQPPCEICPKGVDAQPDTDGLFSLSAENCQLLDLYSRLQTPVFKVPTHLVNDALFAERYRVVSLILRDIERAEDSERLGRQLALQISRFLSG